MTGKMAWTGTLTAKAGNPGPTPGSIALRTYSGQYSDAVLTKHSMA
jgi:hypothetical protein